jgi:putative methylase
MRRKELEIRLQKIPPNPSPKAELEQYATPAGIAADILFEAYALGDVAGKRIADLGCGTGVFAIGAALLGASESLGVDIDGDAVAIAGECARALGAKVGFKTADVREFSGDFDTVFQNPPFGYQARRLDRIFLAKALEVAKVVYTLHHAGASEYIGKFTAGIGCVDFGQNYKFPMKHTYKFHSKPVKPIEVTLYRITRT